MNFEFMTIDTPLPPCMPFPRALTGFPVSSTAKVMYCRMLDAMLSKGQEDENGILFVCFPVTAIAAVLSRSPMTVKRYRERRTLPLPDTSKLEKLNRELEKSEKKLRKAINDEKALQHQLKQLTRKERTHRLCTRGGMLESFLQEPERLTDDDVMLLLKLIFHRQDTQELLKKLLEREKPETP